MKPWEREWEPKPWERYNAPQTPPQATPQTPDSTFLPGMGKGMMDIARGGKQRLDEAAAYLERKLDGGKISQYLGLPTAQQAQAATQAEIDESRRLDAPLMNTTGGKVGQFVGSVVPAIGASFLPGGQTLAGTLATGGALGAATPTSGDESVLKNTALGVGGAGIGYGIGKGIGVLANKASAKAAADKAAYGMRDQAAQAARDAGYTLSPSQTNPTLTNRLLEGVAGKITTSQSASRANEKVTQELAAKAVGLTPEQLTPANLSGVRKVAGLFYEELKNQPAFRPDQQFLDDLTTIAQKNNAVADFPSLFNNKVAGLVDDFANKNALDAKSTVEAIKVLRNSAAKNLKAFDDPEKAALGMAQKQIASAVEDLMERNLATTRPGLVPAFQSARRTIAKAHDIESAMNEATGIINPQKLAKAEGLTDELKTIADTAKAFPKSMQNLQGQSVLPISPLDVWSGLGIGGIGALSGNPWLAAGALARPGIRAGILSRPYQNLMGTPSYGVSPAYGALARSAPALGIETMKDRNGR